MKNDFNPWKVKSLTDFTCVVYRCPECERSFSTSEQFIGHAMMSHPKARDTLPNILNVQDIVPDIRFEEKSEITEKSLVNPDLIKVKQESEIEIVEVKQESEIEVVEVKQESEIEVVEVSVGSRGATPDILNFPVPGAKSTFDKKRKAEDNGYEDTEEEEFGANKKSKMDLSSSVCYGCGKTGHMLRECPDKAVCYGCGKNGHMYRECPDKAEGDVRDCFNCGKFGHIFIECTEPRVCFNCGKPGHMSRECTETTGTHSKLLCYNCNTIGHMARNCDKPLIEKSGFGRIPKIL